MGSDEDPREYDAARKIFIIGLVIVGVLGVLMTVLLLFWVGYFAGGLSLSINLHILFMIVFFVLLHAFVNLIYRIFPEKPKLIVKLTHFLFHFLIVIGVSLGLYFAVDHHNHPPVKNKPADPHFYSFHSWIGLMAIILYYGQFLGGMGTFLLPFTSLRIRQMMLPLHKFLGPLIFLMAVITASLGIMIKASNVKVLELNKTTNMVEEKATYKDLPPSGLVINFSGLLLVLFSLGVIYLLHENRFRRRLRPEGLSDQLEKLIPDAPGTSSGTGDMLLADSKEDSEQQ